MTADVMSHDRSSVLAPFRRILVVCSAGEDDDETLLAAKTLATGSDAAVTVLTVIEPPSEIDRIAHASGMSREDAEHRLVDVIRDNVTRSVARSASDLEPEITIKMGKPFIEIIRHVIANDVDLVIKAADQLDGLSRYLFTSTDQHLLRKCPCPVWLRPQGSPVSVRTILAAVDVDEALASEPETLRGLNRRIMQLTAKMAIEGAVQVHVLHVWDAPGEGLVRAWSNAPDSSKAAQDYVSEIRSRHWYALERLIEQTRAEIGPDLAIRMEFTPKLLRGAARPVIAEQARVLNADILVMGTIARTGVPGFIIGNTAEDVLNSVDCPVVTVKPPTYVSPIQVVGSE